MSKSMGIMPIITLCYGQYCDNDSGQFAQPHPDALNAQKCEEVIRTILKHVKKDLTPDQAIAGMKNAKDAGIDVLLSFIFGLGGIERSKEHIVETTKLLNLLEPEEMAPMALAVQPGTELAKEIEVGQFIQATPLQILEKEKYFLENLSNFNTFYWGDHSNNIVSSRGRLPDNRQAFLKKIENAIAWLYDQPASAWLELPPSGFFSGSALERKTSPACAKRRYSTTFLRCGNHPIKKAARASHNDTHAATMRPSTSTLAIKDRSGPSNRSSHTEVKRMPSPITKRTIERRNIWKIFRISVSATYKK